MKMNKFTFLIVIIMVALILTGCGSQLSSNDVIIESGVNDQEYVGNVCPEVPKDYKITEESKEGMIVVTIKCGVQKEIPAGDSSSGDGGSDEAKPKI